MSFINLYVIVIMLFLCLMTIDISFFNRWKTLPSRLFSIGSQKSSLLELTGHVIHSNSSMSLRALRLRSGCHFERSREVDITKCFSISPVLDRLAKKLATRTDRTPLDSDSYRIHKAYQIKQLLLF